MDPTCGWTNTWAARGDAPSSEAHSVFGVPPGLGVSASLGSVTPPQAQFQALRVPYITKPSKPEV